MGEEEPHAEAGGPSAVPEPSGKEGARSSKPGRSAWFLSGILASGNVLSMALRLVGGLITARFLLPEELGSFNGIGLVLVYAPFLQLGVMNGLNRDLPYYVGRGDRARVERLAACALAVALACGALTGLAALSWAGGQASAGQWRGAAGWASFAVGLLCFFPGMYLQATFRTSSEFAKLAVFQILVAATGLVLTLAVYWFGYFGLCIRLVVYTLVEIALLWHYRPVRVKPSFEAKEFRHLVAIGLPIFAVGYLYTSWRSLDALFILHTLGNESLGLFQLAILTVTAGSALSRSVVMVLYPRMAEEYGRNRDPRAVLRMARRPMLVLAAGGLPAVFVGWLLLPPVVDWMLPNYRLGVPAAQWSLITIWALGFTAGFSIFNVTRQQLLYALSILAGTATFMVSLVMLRRGEGDPLIDFAQAMLLGTLVFVAVGNLLSFTAVKRAEDELRAAAQKGLDG